MSTKGAPLILLAAGGTGGHLFPAEALAGALVAHGFRVDLATDARARRYAGAFPAGEMHVLPAETVRGRSPIALARTFFTLGSGLISALLLLRRLKPAVVVGFGGYPTLPPLVAARLLGIPTVIHEANGVMGRANRLLAPRVNAIATGFPDLFAKEPDLAAKTVWTGNPLRPAVLDVAQGTYPDPAGPLTLLVFGGSQGARVMSDIVPSAVCALDGALRGRLTIVQQAREEDMERVRAAYAQAGIAAEIAPFFRDLPARMAAAHLVISRSGALTVAELAAIGRPSILVPLPNALDQDQAANARSLERIGGAVLIPQAEFTPERLSGELARLCANAGALTEMAQAARSAGTLDAAGRLADLVARLARGAPVLEGKS
ncbi:undecaprenyldiphospho-muramoylpentapeptide beta-N-acetylglucosaminyltransferase [Aquabacter cavernae]|uniref:undecaprenyldiphospho-muramoylpentapeptide beta-N-acetylglucosaminyltransferase n=1 Tax=Aquabacter cavernae TaxID=2496029 RepID=UPI00196B54DE|nr:undecaprenyldiphospho-muramoylpentapeptide beta-N-acetylglucosaminyltransferase [Aquabacter cavernae]